MKCSKGFLTMKNKGFDAWKARLDFFSKEYPFGPIQRFTNEEGNLHKDDGPAYITPTRITWYKNGRKHGLDADKWGSISYYYEGVRIPPHFFTKPESLSITEVLSHANTEVRYVGIKIVGMDKVLESNRTTIIHKDEEKNQILFQIYLRNLYLM